VANHVLGSVLCCPGCFSVYRAKAVRDVLSLYSSTADHAVDFLTKDMGEISSHRIFHRCRLTISYLVWKVDV
jgi:hypothetical protein